MNKILIFVVVAAAAAAAVVVIINVIVIVTVIDIDIAMFSESINKKITCSLVIILLNGAEVVLNSNIVMNVTMT